MVHPAAKFQLERAVQEYARWIAVDAADRSPAPGWWWGPAFAVRDNRDPLPPAWSAMMTCPDGATYADAAHMFLTALAGQIFQPWPEEFPRRYGAPPPADAVPATA